MKFKIELGKLRNAIADVTVPFWFTTDGLIHLAGEKKSTTLDTETISDRHLKEIFLGVRKGDIIASDPAAIENEHSKRFEVKEDKLEEDVKPAEKAPASKDEQRELKTKELLKDAKRLVARSAADLNKEVGSSKVEDNILSPGINNIVLLEAMLEVENKKKEPRKTVVALIEKRIKAIKENGIEVTADDALKIEESEHKKVIFDEETKTLKDIEEGDE